jgi:pimeloyl-ACP methyl ester carboxylesterase
MRFVALATLLILGCGSAVARYTLPSHPLGGRPVIVLVPGYYGTALTDETGERQFITAWKGLFGRVPLARTEPDLGVPGARQLRPDGVLETIRVVPGLYGQDAYGDALGFLRDEFGQHAEIVPFAYDWRQELETTERELDAAIRALVAAGAGPIILVGHSMGGLLTAYYLRYGAQPSAEAVDDGRGAVLVRAAVIVGAPFTGAPKSFRDLQIGTTLAAASIPLAQASISTFPGLYQLLATTSTHAYRNAAFEDLEPFVYNAALWQRWGWGLHRTPTADPVLRGRRVAATADYLARAERFLERIAAPPSQRRRLPVLFCVGTGLPTLGRLVWSATSIGERGEWLFNDAALHARLPALAGKTLEVDGDGTVPTASATPPASLAAAFDSRVVSLAAPHGAMFGKKTFRGTIAAFLHSAGL